MRRAEPLAHPRFTALVLLACVACIVAVHGPLIGYKTFANVDEAYASALAERLLEGFKLYQGAVSQRGPLMYFAFEAIAWLHGWDNIVALRLWGLVLSLVQLGLVYWAGRALLSRFAATIAAVVTTYALVFGFPPADGLAVSGETLQLPALIVGAVLAVLATRHAPGSRARSLRFVASGLLLGVAIAIKQSVALHPLIVLVWIAIDARKRRSSARAAIVDAAVFGASTLVVPALLVAQAAAQGTLRDMIYYCVTYNREVHLRPTTRHFAWVDFVFERMNEQPVFFLTGVLLFAGAWPWLARRVRAARQEGSAWAFTRGFGPVHYLGLHAVVAVIAASSMFRFFPHYYLQALPFIALVVGGVVASAARRAGRARMTRGILIAFTAFTVGAATLQCIFIERVDARVMHDRTPQEVGALIAASTNASDSIFVWGFSPWIYQYAHRRPAGRYVFETYVTGFVPWFWEKLAVEKARIVPGSQEALLGDLDREKPAVVVDAGSVMIARPMRGYEKTNAWLHAGYCFDVRIGAIDVYRRKETSDAACPTPFPTPHEAVDWGGHALPFPLPRALDLESSVELPHAAFDKPVWFAGGPKPRGVDAVRVPRLEKEEADAERDGFWIPKMSDTAPATGTAK